MQDEFNMTQGKLVEAAEREVMIQEQFGNQERMLKEKVQLAQNEVMHLVEVTTKLEKENVQLKEDIMSKDRQLEYAKNAIGKLKCAHNCKKAAAEEEINSLKNEINILIQKQNTLLREVRVF